ncbi:hypothetical protein L1987_81407 [Smallanthus sonchifolius]|uniref:Uncharacterized protein n=1 Tax=Smallanthus sonchifolius TaxID=185202 RepID=A0ACB8YRM6_9ASTR|nr:hypothetical protein L1987_81407 [Smallanthus sonchifolius]
MILDQDHHPYFVSTLKQYDNLRMFIPKKFALANGLSNGEIVFKNVENEGLWTVKLRSQSEKYFCIQHGLREFCNAIKLEKGDSFRFELIHNGKKPVAIDIPLAFARSNKLDMRSCEMFLMDEKQRLWPTRLHDSGGHVCIRGLRDMWVANGVKKGDVFSVEIVENGNKPHINFHRHGTGFM